MEDFSDTTLIPGSDASFEVQSVLESSETMQGFPEIETSQIEWDIVQKISSRLLILEERNQLITDILDNVCSELRTSLSDIKGLSGSLMQHSVELEKETRQDFLETIERESDKLSTMVNDLLQTWYLETGNFTLRKSKTSFSVIFGQVGTRLKELTHDHQFEVNIDKCKASICVDIKCIADIIITLIERSVLYSDPGTRITLETIDNKNEIIVSVTDWSRGIPAKGIEKIFDRFHTAKANTNTSNKDIGLGLVVCKRIIEAHGGKIWITNKPGRGCKFSFSLPTEHESISADFFDMPNHKEARE